MGLLRLPVRALALLALAPCLAAAPDASFTPSLEVVDSLLRSLQPVEPPSQP